jgi:hypothetical protein
MWELSLDKPTQMKTELSDESADPLPPDQIDLQRTALLLDVDGTLLEIAATPKDVVVPPALRGTLKQLLGEPLKPSTVFFGRFACRQSASTALKCDSRVMVPCCKTRPC